MKIYGFILTKGDPFEFPNAFLWIEHLHANETEIIRQVAYYFHVQPSNSPKRLYIYTVKGGKSECKRPSAINFDQKRLNSLPPPFSRYRKSFIFIYFYFILYRMDTVSMCVWFGKE